MPQTASTPRRIVERIATELGVRPEQVSAAVDLLDDGATVPFIARYRKEATAGLDDTHLRTLEERLGYLRELEDRRAVVLKSIDEQGKLSDELRGEIDAAETKQRLEDLYAPYKPKRRTKAQIAREAGIEPLADALLADPTLDPQAEAARYLNAEAGFADAKAVLDGARDILAERFAEDADLLGRLRERLWEDGIVRSKVVEGKEEAGAKFRDYFDHEEPIRTMPSHRALAVFRGRKAEVLTVKLGLPAEQEDQSPHPFEGVIASRFGIAREGRAADAWLAEVCRWTWRVRIQFRLEVDLFLRLAQAAEAEAIQVFGKNLRDLLLAAPAGPKSVIGLDPGVRTGVKVAVVDATGKLLDTATVYPHEPRRDWDGAIAAIAALSRKHSAKLVAIGNGTASRETDRLVADLAKCHPELGITRIVVSEAGASVYSASELAAAEFPDLDVSLRGAVSIARRLQDPLAELVKIDPKSIGVGQYQHDVDQSGLARTLDGVVEDCVNAVGVDLNTASVPLLTRVSGLNASIARNIVELRSREGAFRSRESLRAVPRLGDKTFEQAAGFLRITEGDNPLDRTGVHPEAYPVVERILARLDKPIGAVMGNRDVLAKLAPEQFTDERFGVPTVRDILAELEKPGRDPRPEFRAARFAEGVENLSDLKPGMRLEGTVTNVANFGAFVDIGVHQDGLVHVSALADRFVKDPREVVKAGDVVKVKVLEVDLQRKRIALTMRLSDDAPADRGGRRDGPGARPGEKRPAPAADPRRARPDDRRAPRPSQPALGGAMAEAFAKLRSGKS